MTVSELRDWLDDAQADDEVFIRPEGSESYYDVSYLVIEKAPGSSDRDFVIELETVDED